MAKLDLVYIGKFTIKDLNVTSRIKFNNNELNVEDITKNNLDSKSKDYLDRCAYAIFICNYKRKILKNINI